MRRLTALDAGFRELDDEDTTVSIGGTAVFEGPAPAHAEMERLYRTRLQAAPRCRQRMRSVPLELNRPVWVDDPHFDLSYHLRRVAVPAPGGDTELATLIGRIFSPRLDLTRSPWEAWVVEGLADDRWAVVTKMHHSMADGLAGMALFANLLDARHSPCRKRGAIEEPSESAPPRVIAAARAVSALVRHPWQTAAATLAATRGALAYAVALRPTSPTSLTGELGSARRYRFTAVDRDDIALLRDRLGGSPNDAALAIVTRAFRRFLVGRGERPSAHAVRCLVPVSVRGPADVSDANRVSAMLVELPVDLADPGSAYGATVVRMSEVKSSHEIEAGERAVSLAGYLPPAWIAGALHAAFRIPQRILTTVVTNVAGPRYPARMLGRTLVALYPYVPIADRIRVGIAVCPYGDHLFFGITCDRDSVRDADDFVDGIRDGAAELVEFAATVRGAAR